MGLFDLFTPKKLTPCADGDISTQLLAELEKRLVKLGYHVTVEHPAVFVESQLTITVEMGCDAHSQLPVTFTLRNRYLPGNIELTVTGEGDTAREQIDSVLKQFIQQVFLVVQSAFSESHKSDWDFMAQVNGREIRFHPKSGILESSGQWPERLLDNGSLVLTLLKLLQQPLEQILIDRKFNWIELRVIQPANSPCYVQCKVNNQPWPDGETQVATIINSWPKNVSTRSARKLIILRLCDTYEQLV